MSEAPTTSPGSVLTLRTFVRRGWVAIVVGIVIGTGAGAYLQHKQVAKYTSTATVQVVPTGIVDNTQTTTGRTAGAVNPDTEVNLVKSTPVLDRARKALKSPLTDMAIAKNILVTVPANTTLLKIAYTGSTPSAAQSGANAVAAAYLADRLSTARGVQAANVKSIQASIKKANDELTKLVNDSAKYTSTSPSGKLAAAQESQLSKQITSLTEQLSTTTTTNIQAGSIVGSPVLPTAAAGASKALYYGSGFAVGLLLGLFAAWLIARRPASRLRAPSDVDALLGVPVIGRIAEVEPGRLAPVSSESAEAYRRLVNVVNASLDSGGRVLVIAGADGSDLASTVTHNIAATLSRSGERVAVLRSDESEAPQSGDDDSSYRILPSSGPRTRKAIEELAEREDGFILVDAPEARKTADAQSYGAIADAVILVMREQTKTAAAKEILAEFDAVSAPVLGAVMVRLKKASSNVATSALTTGDGSGPARTAIGRGPSGAEAESDGELRSHGKAQLHPESEAPGGSLSAAARRVARRNDRLRARADRD